MDLHNITALIQPRELNAVSDWNASMAWLAGGTWLFSEPQPQLTTLIDLEPLNWAEIEASESWLKIGSMCTLEQLQAYPWPTQWCATGVFKEAIAALAASFKVVQQATIGGNICLALAVGVIPPVMVLLDAVYELWSANQPPRLIAAKDFQTGVRETVLRPGEVLRRVLIPHRFLDWRTTVQKLSIAATDPSISLVCAAVNPTDSTLRVSLGASVAAPTLVQFSQLPSAQEIRGSLASIDWLQDLRASAGYREQVTQVLIQRAIATLTQV